MCIYICIKLNRTTTTKKSLNYFMSHKPKEQKGFMQYSFPIDHVHKKGKGNSLSLNIWPKT